MSLRASHVRSLWGTQALQQWFPTLGSAKVSQDILEVHMAKGRKTSFLLHKNMFTFLTVIIKIRNPSN